MELDGLSVKELLILQSDVIYELKARNVVRTKNNPLGDYTEWLVAQKLNLELANNSAAGFDAQTNEGLKIQIKGRRVTPENKSRQLSAIRNYENKDFDYLVAVIFDKDFSIIDAQMIPHEVVGEYASYRQHVNAYILHLKGAILNDDRVKCIKEQLI